MLFFNEKGLNMWMIAPNEMLHIRSMSVLMEENMRCRIHASAAKKHANRVLYWSRTGHFRQRYRIVLPREVALWQTISTPAGW